MEDLMIKIDNVSKQYKLGQIGGTTLRDELQRVGARIRGREDPTKRIGARDYNRGETFMALNGISFKVKKGERVGIIGHNGAGKSTLLKLISRVTAPTGGTIYMNGRVASILEVGTGFHGELTGRENIYMNGAILGMTRREIEAKIEDIINFSECRQFIDTPVKRYSSGMYVKLAFSVAAHLESEILIMDEVLAVGDMAFQKKCLDKMNDVSHTEGRTILYVSHNMNTIRQLCDRVVVLDHGKVAFDGGVEEGIGAYMGVMKESETSIDYTDAETPGWIDIQDIKLLNARYIGKDSVNFSNKEEMLIELKWRNMQDVQDLCFRIEFRKDDRTPIGTSFIYDFYSGDKGEQVSRTVRADISQLVSGNYTTKYTFFLKNQQGGNRDSECVDGLSFQIIEDGDIAWNRKMWGTVHFSDIALKGGA